MMMPAAGAVPAAGATPPPAAEEAAAPEKTAFSVKLEKFDPASKIKVREEGRVQPGAKTTWRSRLRARDATQRHPHTALFPVHRLELAG